jgi:hypothetical protein
VSFAPYHELEEPGAVIVLAREAMLGKQREQQLCCRAYDTARCDVSAQHLPARIGYGHMQVRAIRRYRPSEREYLQIAAQPGCIVRACEAQLGDAQTANTLKHERGMYAELSQCVLQREAQIIAGGEAQRMSLHCVSPQR